MDSLICPKIVNFPLPLNLPSNMFLLIEGGIVFSLVKSIGFCQLEW